MRTHKTPEQRLSKLDAALGLSPAQHQQAKVILEQAAQAHTDELTRHTRRQLRHQTHDKLRALLEPDQQEVFEQLGEQRRTRRIARRLERMDKALDLSPQQHKQIKAIMEQTRRPPQDDASHDDERAQHHAMIMAVLDDAQRQSHQEHLEQRRQRRRH